MRILIVDDERPAREELQYMISEILPDASVEAVSGGVEAIEMLSRDGGYNAIFMDINLGDMSGLSVAMAAHKLAPDAHIAFATAYDKYALEAFEIGAVDYILKPFNSDRLSETLKRFSSERAGENIIGSVPERISVNSGKKIHMLDVESITFIEAVNRGCVIHTSEGEEIIDQNTLSSFEKKLMGTSFFKIHKSFLVNLTYLKHIEATMGRTYSITLKDTDGQQIPVGRNALKILRSIYDF